MNWFELLLLKAHTTFQILLLLLRLHLRHLAHVRHFQLFVCWFGAPQWQAKKHFNFFFSIQNVSSFFARKKSSSRQLTELVCKIISMHYQRGPKRVWIWCKSYQNLNSSVYIKGDKTRPGLQDKWNIHSILRVNQTRLCRVGSG